MNEAYVNRLYHMEDVANIIIDVAEKEGVLLADNYNYIDVYKRQARTCCRERFTSIPPGIPRSFIFWTAA